MTLSRNFPGAARFEIVTSITQRSQGDCMSSVSQMCRTQALQIHLAAYFCGAGVRIFM